MKKRLIAAIAATLILCSFASFTAFADETAPIEEIPPVEVTEDVIATEEPYYTEATDIETQPYTEDFTAEYTEAETTYPVEDTTSADYTDPSATSATETTVAESTIAETTVAETTFVMPTEPQETETYSDYESPAPVYTPADQDFDANNWQEIKLDLEAPANGKGNFDFIQKNNTKGNDSIAHFLIIGIILIFLSIAGFTFVILYRPNKAAAKQSRSSSSAQRRSSASGSSRRSSNRSARKPERPTFDPDDYNDGF